MGRFARCLGVLVFAAAASIGCGLVTGASDFETNLPDDAQADAGGGDDSVAPPPPGPITCGAGTKLCGDECVSNVDPAFGCGGTSCDRCMVAFAASLKCDAQGRCAPNACFDGRADCNGDPTDGCEADLSLPQTCGSCSVTCNNGQLCAGRLGCVTTCPMGTSPCGMSCVDLTSSAAHCGTCTKVCPSAPNAIAACKASTCTITCNAGYGDCDSNPSNGCEALTPYFVDADMDGQGAKGSMSAGQACAIPAGYSAVADDCEDDNANVFLGQPKYFDAPYPVMGTTTESFDYNCSGREEIQPFSMVSMCPVSCTPGYVKNAVTGSPCGSTEYAQCLTNSCTALGTKPALKCH